MYHVLCGTELYNTIDLESITINMFSTTQSGKGECAIESVGLGGSTG